MSSYDVVIVGTGPAGIFAALKLIESSPSLKVLMLEKGKDISKRHCPMLEKGVPCRSCSECSIISGWGGAGAFSDGKLNLSTEIGGFLHRYIDKKELSKFINLVDKEYIRFGAPKKVYGGNTKKIAEIKALAEKNSLEFIPNRVRHIGTDRCLKVLKNIKDVKCY